MNRKQRKAHAALWPALILLTASVSAAALIAKSRTAEAATSVADER